MFHLVQYRDHTGYDELKVAYCKTQEDAQFFWNHDGGPISCLEQRDVHEYFRVIVAGGREFKDYSLLSSALDYYLEHINNPVIISGHARGADKLGERYAKERDLLIDTFIPDWRPNNLKGKTDMRAGHTRNADMARNADSGVVFWDGLSRGTEGMLKLLKRHQLQYKVVKY